VERTYKDRAVAASCYRTFQLALAEYSTATADHRYETSPYRLNLLLQLVILILFFTHAWPCPNISIIMLKFFLECYLSTKIDNLNQPESESSLDVKCETKKFHRRIRKIGMAGVEIEIQRVNNRCIPAALVLQPEDCLVHFVFGRRPCGPRRLIRPNGWPG
jgi:hypothetical protein